MIVRLDNSHAIAHAIANVVELGDMDKNPYCNTLPELMNKQSDKFITLMCTTVF